MRAVIDPGVYISAALSSIGAPAQLMRRWRLRQFDMVVSPTLLDELGSLRVQGVREGRTSRRAQPRAAYTSAILSQDVRMHGTRFAPWVGLAALVAGVLWAAHGAFEMLQPLGHVTEYRDDLGYSIITDARGFRLYGLPGPPAVLLSAAVSLAAVRRGRVGWRRTVATWLAGVAAVLAVAAVVGVVVPLDPPFEAGMNFGRLLVSVAAVVAGGLLRRDGETRRPGTLLRLAGWIGVLVLVARVMVNAMGFVPGAVAFGISVVLGLAWVVAGLHFLGHRSAIGVSRPA